MDAHEQESKLRSAVENLLAILGLEKQARDALVRKLLSDVASQEVVALRRVVAAHAALDLARHHLAQELVGRHGTKISMSWTHPTLKT